MANAILLSSSLAQTDKEKAAQVAALLPDWDILLNPTDEELRRRYSDLCIAFGGSPRELADHAPNLRWLQLGGAGADRLFMDGSTPSFTVTNASGVHAVPISEHLLAMMLAFGRGLHRSRDNQRGARIWRRPERQDLFEIEDARVVVVGLGAIGGRFAAITAALGAHVTAVRRHPENGHGAARDVVGADELQRLLPEAEHLVITTPLTRETEGLIGERELALLKKGAFVYNIGRGRIIDEDALTRALQSGHLGGAGLDVFEQEPLPAGSPLWDMENVIVTCHYAGLTPRYAERCWDIFMDNLRRFVSGEPLANIVDPELGY